MKRIGFIIAAESYILRKGLGAILSRIPGVQVVREFDKVGALHEYLKQGAGEMLVVSQSIFENLADLYADQAHLLDRTILIRDISPGFETPHAGAVISICDEKDAVVGKFLEAINRSGAEEGSSGMPELTPREKTIIRMVSMGYTNRQIAELLYLSTHTVITHRKNISGKLGIKSVSGLTIYAIVNNIITIGEISSKPEA
jgi:DNA-binding CsgD family transcriptional regulator